MSTLTAHHPLDTAAANTAPCTRAVPESLSVDDLRDLMQTVTQTTQRLQATHVALHEQVARLQRELAEANAALRRSQALAALGEMAAGIAHEVRNPLASIRLYTQMLADDLADRPPQAELCGKIDRAVVTLDAIVRDVLSFAREMRIESRPTTAGELLDSAVHSCAALVNGYRIDIERTGDDALELHADVHRMTQALGNVVRNAIEAMVEHDPDARMRRRLVLCAERARVRDASGAVRHMIALIVQDNGPGIADEVRDRIFNPFFTTRATGTGLGLAIVHRIMDAHGGHIELDNVQPHGARIALCLPIDHERCASRDGAADAFVLSSTHAPGLAPPDSKYP